MYVLEFGAGHCKLGWHMANELSRRRKQDAESPHICVVMCDLSMDALEDRMRLPCFQTMMEDGVVDFARVDVSRLTNKEEGMGGVGGKRGRGMKHIDLLFQKIELTSEIQREQNGLVVIGNYFLDSLPIDMYRTRRRESSEEMVVEEMEVAENVGESLERLCVVERTSDIARKRKRAKRSEEIMVEEESSKNVTGEKKDVIGCSSMWRSSMEFVWEKTTMTDITDVTGTAEGTPPPPTSSPRSSQVLVEYIRRHMSKEASSSLSSSFLMVPSGAMEFVRDIQFTVAGRSNDVLFLFGDKTFGSRTPFVLSGDKENEYPIIVHHGEEKGGGGCISTSVDLSFISAYVRELARERGEEERRVERRVESGVENGEESAEENGSSDEQTTRRRKEYAAHGTTLVKTFIVEDRVTSSGGEFDVYACTTRKEEQRDGRDGSGATSSSSSSSSSSLSSSSSSSSSSSLFSSPCTAGMISVTDVEAVVGLVEHQLEDWSMSHLLDVLSLCNYDYDVFDMMRWELARRVKSRRRTTTAHDDDDDDDDNHALLLAAAQKCFANRFDVVSSTDYELKRARATLVHARWLYVLDCFKACSNEICVPWFHSLGGVEKLSSMVGEMRNHAKQIMYVWMRACQRQEEKTLGGDGEKADVVVNVVSAGLTMEERSLAYSSIFDNVRHSSKDA